MQRPWGQTGKETGSPGRGWAEAVAGSSYCPAPRKREAEPRRHHHAGWGRIPHPANTLISDPEPGRGPGPRHLSTNRERMSERCFKLLGF